MQRSLPERRIHPAEPSIVLTNLDRSLWSVLLSVGHSASLMPRSQPTSSAACSFCRGRAGGFNRRFEQEFVRPKVGIMAIDTVLLECALVTFNSGQILFLVAIEAKLAGRFCEQRAFGGLMGAVTGGAIAIARRVMFEWSLGQRLLQIFMTIETELIGSLAQQLFLIGNVRAVAGSAVTILDRLMLDLRPGDLLLHIFVAIHTKFVDGFAQQLLIVRGMRVMAGEAISILDRLMFYLGLSHLLPNVLMALVTQFVRRLA